MLPLPRHTGCKKSLQLIETPAAIKSPAGFDDDYSRTTPGTGCGNERSGNTGAYYANIGFRCHYPKAVGPARV